MDDLNRLIVDLSRAGALAGLRVAKVVEQAGIEVRDEARRFAPKTGLPHYGEKITHELTVTAGSVTVEVGPEKGGQGSLGHILERGTADAPPQAHLLPAHDRAVPGFVKGISDIGGSLL